MPHYTDLQVNQSLKLTPSQQSLVFELWQSFQGRMGKLMEVRCSIHACMRSTMPDGVFGRSFAINFLKVAPNLSNLALCCTIATVKIKNRCGR